MKIRERSRRDWAPRLTEVSIEIVDGPPIGEIIELDDSSRAAEIIRAVNSHDEMVEALQELTRLWSDFSSQDMYGEHLREGLQEIDFDEWARAHSAANLILAKLGAK